MQGDMSFFFFKAGLLNWEWMKNGTVSVLWLVRLKLDLYDLNNLQIHYYIVTIKIRILSETSILYLIRYASIILIVCLHL